MASYYKGKYAIWEGTVKFDDYWTRTVYVATDSTSPSVGENGFRVYPADAPFGFVCSDGVAPNIEIKDVRSKINYNKREDRCVAGYDLVLRIGDKVRGADWGEIYEAEVICTKLTQNDYTAAINGDIEAQNKLTSIYITNLYNGVELRQGGNPPYFSWQNYSSLFYIDIPIWETFGGVQEKFPADGYREFIVHFAFDENGNPIARVGWEVGM